MTFKYCPRCNKASLNIGQTHCSDCNPKLQDLDCHQCSQCGMFRDATVADCPDCLIPMTVVKAKKCPCCNGVALAGILDLDMCPRCVLTDVLQCPECGNYYPPSTGSCSNCVQTLGNAQTALVCPGCSKLYPASKDKCDSEECTMGLEECTQVTCPKCGGEFDQAAFTTCPNCVIPLAGMTRCKTCGRFDFAKVEECATPDCPGPFEDYVPVPNVRKRKGTELTADVALTVEPPTEAHNVKGTRRDGKYCVTVTAEKVTWSLPTVTKARKEEEGETSGGRATKQFLRPTLVVAKLKCTKVGNRNSPPIPLSALETEEAADAEEDIAEDAEISDAEAPAAPSEGDEKVASTKEEKNELGKLAELREFDKGHLVALFLGGVDSSWNIIPQVRDCNRNAWLSMENELYRITKDKVGSLATVGVAVDRNTLGRKAVRLYIYPFYADLGGQKEVGDPRIPVWLYVQVRLGKKAIAHYSFANACREMTAFPGDEMIQCFKRAHKALGIPYPDPKPANSDVEARFQELYVDEPPAAIMLTRTPNECALDVMNQADERRKRILRWRHKDESLMLVQADIDNLLRSTDEELKGDIDYYQKALTCVDTSFGPYRALQWLYNNSGHCDGTKCVPPQSFVAGPFEVLQIEVIRKYNLWRSGGCMISDAAKQFNDQPWNQDERPDPYGDMDESSGQAYPEVDHIVPKKSGGLNSYSNARLVSFSLNHIYREKPSSCPGINDLIEADVKRRQFGFTASDEGMYKRHLKKFKDDLIKEPQFNFRKVKPDDRFMEGLKDRRKYLLQMEKRHALCERVAELSDRFKAVRETHAAGCADFRKDPDTSLRSKMLAFQFELELKLWGPKQFGLNDISDEIECWM